MQTGMPVCWGGDRYLRSCSFEGKKKANLWSSSLKRKTGSVKCAKVNENYVFLLNHEQFLKQSHKFWSHYRIFSGVLAVGK